ncbi:MAG: uroporphyrinogen decarboxylase [Pirellulales bacterium]|nr:uroporphyrinogen decarboxylase [Pirellulales bacterium]
MSSLFLSACRRQPTPRTPIWLMRQAGRYLPCYRQIREKTTFLELCKNAELCAEVMLLTVEELQVDAAIIFADLLPILEPLGFELEFTPGEGPIIHNPVRTGADLARLRELENLAALEFVPETVRLTKAGLPPHIPVIGFAGAPFTLASYAIEGSGSRQYPHTKRLMYTDPGAWHALCQLLTRAIVRYLNGQIAAGADCVQIFDSWVGCLSPADYRHYVLPHMQSLFAGLTPSAPVIHFGAGNPALLPLIAEAGGDVIGLDWRTEFATGWQAVGHARAVQGNLDPLVLLGSSGELRRQARAILEAAGSRPGHIFNLGHGIVPQTDPARVRELIAIVKEESAKIRGG